MIVTYRFTMQRGTYGCLSTTELLTQIALCIMHRALSPSNHQAENKEGNREAEAFYAIEHN
jgi:hypothetical protein